MVRLDEFAEYFDVTLPEEEDVETIAGIVVKKLERIAAVNDEADFGDFKLIVEEIDGTRITKIKIIKKAVEPANSSAEE